MLRSGGAMFIGLGASSLVRLGMGADDGRPTVLMVRLCCMIGLGWLTTSAGAMVIGAGTSLLVRLGGMGDDDGGALMVRLGCIGLEADDIGSSLKLSASVILLFCPSEASLQ